MARARDGLKTTTKTKSSRRRMAAAPGSAPPVAAVASAASSHAWTFLSNHAHVLLCLAEDPATRLRDVAVRVGITERAVQKIVADLEAAAVLTRTRDGRRNHYAIDATRPLRHPIEQHRTVAALLDLLRP